MSPDNAGGTFAEIRSYRGGNGMWLNWSGSLNTNWVSIRIGTSSSSYTTLTRTGDFAITSGTIHYSDATSGSGGSDPVYITNTDNASMYFAVQT
jgi:flavin reductase (DIM6/NTAB) family NADH-FMN oxidoreductase RutF